MNCYILDFFNYRAEKDWGIKPTRKIIEDRKTLFYQGELKISFLDVLYYYENEVFKCPLRMDDKRMEDVSLNYHSTVDYEDNIYFRYLFYDHNCDNNINPGYVYLIKNEHTGLYKIGVSKNIDERVNSLQMSNGVELDVVDTVFLRRPYTMESFLHLVFSRERKLGEWFDLSQKDLKEIDFLIKYIKED